MPAQRPAPVQEFRPSSGVLLGWGSLAVLAVVLVVALVTEPSLLGVRIALGLALAGTLVWAVLLRPRATAYPDSLVLRQAVSDTWLPLAEVEEVAVGHTLNVRVGDRRYVCAGIGRTTRQMLRRRAPAGPLGAGLGGQSPATGAGADYATFVETRIEELARAARREGGSPPPVRRVWAVPEIIALLTLGVAFAVSLAL